MFSLGDTLQLRMRRDQNRTTFKRTMFDSRCRLSGAPFAVGAVPELVHSLRQAKPTRPVALRLAAHRKGRPVPIIEISSRNTCRAPGRWRRNSTFPLTMLVIAARTPSSTRLNPSDARDHCRMGSTNRITLSFFRATFCI